MDTNRNNRLVEEISLLKQKINWLEKLKLQQKKEIDALRASEQKYRFIAENAVDIITIMDMNLHFTYVSPSVMRVRGFSVEEAKAQTLDQIFPPKDLDYILSEFEEEMQIEASGTADPDRTRVLEAEEYTKDGSLIWMEISVSYLRGEANEPIGILAISRDITERKHAALSLKKSEQALRTIFENVHDAIFIHDTNGKVLDVNHKTLELFKLAKEQAYPRTIIDDFSSPDNPIDQLAGRWQRVLNGENITFEWKARRPLDDVTFDVEVSLKKINLGEQDVVLANVRDISLQKAAEAVLRKNEENFRTLVENSSDAIMRFDRQLRHLYVNPAVEIQSGIHPHAFIGKTHEEMGFPNNLCILWKEALEEVFQTGKIMRTEFQLPSGIWIDWMLMPEMNDVGEITTVIASARDISERKKSEERLRDSEEKLARSKKMESIALMAGGVAHDLNNVLAGIVTYPEMLLFELPGDSILRKPIETIQAAGQRAAAIVEDLLTVARGVATSKSPINLNEIVEDYLTSPEFQKLKEFHPAIEFITILNEKLLNILGSDMHLRKVIMNLVSNASEAVENGGCVVISTMNRYVDRPLKRYEDVKIGEYVVLSITDDGPGISPDDLERIFEPFFTKKVMGRSGTGLGLAIVWNIVQGHEGYIDVSPDENGTVFELYFPITREQTPEKVLLSSLEDLRGNGETILIVDDIESQRYISQTMLEGLGYQTHSVASGEEAIEFIKENKVELILLDMIMDPGINGRETYEEIIKITPKQKAIIASGFAETDDVKKTQDLGAGKFLKKPFRVQEVGAAVKDALKK